MVTQTWAFRRFNPGVLILLLAICWSSGCDKPVTVPNAVPVQGELLQAGQPLQVTGREIGTGMVQLTFVAVTPAADSQPFSATVDEQGKFDLPGGMPPGKYRVVVRQWEPYPQTDKLGGRYDEENTPLVVDVDGKTLLKIDLTTPAAEAK
jgi:hypothetical protein